MHIITSLQKMISTRTRSRPLLLLVLLTGLALIPSTTNIVSAFHVGLVKCRLSSSQLKLSTDDEINRSVQRAKELLEKSKAKLAAKEASLKNPLKDKEEDKEKTVPFFAKTRKVTTNRKSVIKSKTADGLVLADGEKMAALSEQEEWEMRGLYDVFQSEIDVNEDVYSLASEQLASRDVAASIFNLRRTLQQEDYKKIFDKRNYFIGEDN